MRHAFDRCQETNLPVLTRLNGDRVAIVNKLKQRLQGMVAVSTLTGDI